MESWSGQGVNRASTLAALFYDREERGCSLCFFARWFRYVNLFLTMSLDVLYVTDIMHLLVLNQNNSFNG
jgi:hypothetical protein